MKKLLDWQSKEVVDLFDEVSLWTAPFAHMMLEHIPMRQYKNVLDIGFGTGFPLLELSQRFGQETTIHGMDIWEEAIKLTERKIKLFELNNIHIYKQSAEVIPLEDNSIDLACSNLGINNFNNRSKVITEVHRVLKAAAPLCITTNPIGTFNELAIVFKAAFKELGVSTTSLEQYFLKRGTEDSISEEFTSQGFKLIKKERSQFSFRYTNGRALFNHAFIRIAFLESWEQLIEKEMVDAFIERSIHLIDQIVREKGEFKMHVPVLYLQFEKT